ncbi:MAG TPA: c-type cytochrome [Candidatus Binataceae bacterium]|nr:c-type cytochrome [Candidatus Binataceae bacterium]
MVRRMISVVTILSLFFAGQALAADAAKGKRIADQKCAGCHGAGGAGNGVMLQMLNVTTPPVPWTDKNAMAAYTDADLTKIISGGGAAIGKPPLMPAFKGQLSDAKIANVIAYIRSLAP